MYSISSSDKIKRCPCCGNQYPTEIRDNNTVYVHCSHCGFKTKEYYYTDKQKAIDEWNNSISPWHTGIPAEEGWYLLKVKSDDEIIYDTNRLIQFLWGLDWKYVHEEILAWRKIEEEEKNNG